MGSVPDLSLLCLVCFDPLSVLSWILLLSVSVSLMLFFLFSRRSVFFLHGYSTNQKWLSSCSYLWVYGTGESVGGFKWMSKTSSVKMIEPKTQASFCNSCTGQYSQRWTWVNPQQQCLGKARQSLHRSLLVYSFSNSFIIIQFIQHQLHFKLWLWRPIIKT